MWLSIQNESHCQKMIQDGKLKSNVDFTTTDYLTNVKAILVWGI
jgi:hypothetical protein